MDWQQVSDTIDAAKLTHREDVRTVKECVLAAYTRWYDQDAATLDVLSLEAEETRLVDASPFKPFKYVLDMYAQVRVDVPRTKIRAGQYIICDYKTTAYDLSTAYGKQKFRESYGGGKQHHYYKSARPEADWFWYRGVSKAHQGGTCDLLIPLRRTDYLSSDYEAAQAARAALIDSQSAWWYRNFDACQDYGHTCPHFEACRQTHVPTSAPLVVPAHLSHSQISSFWTCAERYKRDRLVGSRDLGGESDASLIGTAFHSAMHTLYTSLLEGN